jgi:uncharacterized protein with HEPN domain
VILVGQRRPPSFPRAALPLRAATRWSRERHPDLPWRAIMGVGNVVRHSYDDVVEEQVWRTVLEDLPVLDRAIAAELEGSK